VPSGALKISIPDVTAEDELLLYCTRPGIDSEAALRIRWLAQANLDWTRLLGNAQYHGLLPLVAYQLTRTCPNAVPATWSECLFDYCLRTEAGGRRAISELSRILRMFEANAIHACTFRGPALAASIYGHTAFREFNALNVVVQRESVFEAKALLLRDGYRPARTFTPGQELAQVRFRCSYRLDRPGDRMHVWLHTQIDPGAFSAPLDLRGLSHRLATISVDGREVTTLSPEDLLITLCAYLVQPDPPRLCALADIAKLIAVHRTMDWDELLRRSRALGVRRRLFAGLLMASDLLGADLPERVALHTQTDVAARDVASELAGRFFHKRTSPGIRERIHFHVQARERRRDRIRFVCRAVFNPTESDWCAVRLPARFCALYRVVRPIRLAGALAGLVPRGDLAPFMPAPIDAVERMLTVAQVGPSDVVYDIGSGDGRIVITAAKRYGARGIGIDIDAGRVAEAEANAHQEGVQHLVHFIRRNAMEVDLSAATVVTLYLGAAANLLLRPKLQSDLRPGTRLVSLDYDMADWAPMRAELVPHDSGVSQVFMWRIGEEETHPPNTSIGGSVCQRELQP
jgi:Uncharacterised nucleotidyltransferase/Methyltransferase domain